MVDNNNMEELGEYIYNNFDFIDMDRLSDFKEDLYQLGYLPCLLRKKLNKDYYFNVVFNDEIDNKLKNSRNQSYLWKLTEIYDWGKVNNQYSIMIHMDELGEIIEFLKGL